MTERKKTLYSKEVDGQKFCLTRDGNGWTVSEVATVEDKKSKNYGQEVHTDQSYFGMASLNLAIESLCQKLAFADCKDLKGYIKKLKEHKDDIVKLCNA